MSISIGTISKIDAIFEKAYKENRHMLYEHEVYEMLDWVGLDTLKNILITDVNKVTKEMLQPYGEKVVIKVVSKDVIHKQKVGGVKIVNKHDAIFVQYVIDKMREEVNSHFDKDNQPNIEGFLIVEFVEFTNSLGNELLIGIKSDRAFGPVITLSKGGDDAEFFAKYYDPANLILPPLTYEQAVDLTKNTKIRHKYIETGHTKNAEMIANSVEIISSLAYHYSKVNNETTPFYITQADFNPFVFSKTGRFVAVDGYISFDKAVKEENMLKINTNNLETFFKPNGVAVVGVSSQENKHNMGKEIAHLIHELNRKDLYCINPKGGSVKIGNKQYKLYKSIDEVNETIELAIYTAPAKYIPAFFEEMKINIPKSVVLIPGIPSEMGYDKFKADLDKTLKEEIRIIGPNCMGIYYGKGDDAIGINSLFIEEERLHITSNEKSNVVLLSQSGGMAITLVDKLQNTPIFKAVISFGNKYDVKITDLISLFFTQDNIEVIALYVEGFDNIEGRIFFEMAKKSNKPIIVYKGGKTEAGAKAAKSHTAAMTGDYEVFKAVCKQANVILVEDASMYMNCIKTFSMFANKEVNGVNVAGVLNAGFEATIASDELGKLKIAKPTNKTLEKLDKINTSGLVNTKTGILDVTPMTDDVKYGQYIETFLQDENVDSVLVGVVPHVENIKSTPDTCHDKDSLANIVVSLSKKYNKPIIVSVNASEYYDEFVSIMEKGGLPVFSDIRSAVRTLEIFVNYKKNQ